MKDLLKNFTIFAALCIVFSGLTGCQTASTESGSNNATETKKKNDPGYPAAPAAIAQTEIKMIDNATFKLEDKKGKVILFNLWGTWCLPCIREMPHLIELQDKYRDKGFEIIGLSVGDQDMQPEPEEAIKTFAAKHKLNYQLGHADRNLFEEFIKVSKMAGVPQSLLINRDGKVTGVFTGGGQNVIVSMKETVEKVVNE